MGSTGSRSRLSQVAPCHSQPEGDQDQQASHPTSQWTIPAVPTPLEPQHGPLGHRRTTQLPPLKLENPASFPPLSTAASHRVKATFGDQASFILIHHEDYREDSWRHRWSSVNRPSGDGEPTRDESESIGGPSSKGIPRLHLLNRPTQKDIFWDEMTGESLDLKEILQPSPLPLEQGESQQSQPGPPQCLCRDEELINRDLAWGGLRSPHWKTNTLTDRVAGETDGGLTMRKTLPWMLDWKTEKQRDPIPKHLSSLGDSERASRWPLREGIRGLCHGERGIWEPDLD
ncbi:unnamed protein product [Coregonus sp. 'balchen']|nr:unnamed protein product [Coregonus sp. 'balchen']